MTLAELIQDYLDDPETRMLTSYDDYHRLLGWRSTLQPRRPESPHDSASG